MNFIQIGQHIFPTVLAITAEEHTRGLMFVKDSAPIMSFIYHKAMVNKMWMKNTFIPLDILFCRAGEIVHIGYGQPHSEELIGPEEETDLVVELPKGMVQRFAIQVGQRVDVAHTTGTLAKKIASRSK